MIQKGLKVISRFLMSRQTNNILANSELKYIGKETGLHCITDIPKNPFNLFKTWHKEQSGNSIQTNALCLSTASKDGKVSSRNLILRRLDDDGFVIMTDKRSKKCRQLDENPYAAITFLWVKEENGNVQSRQVRAEGLVNLLKDEEWTELYEQEPLFCKIRAYICHQGSDCDWEKMKTQHDRLLTEWLKGETQLNKPDHVVAYKMKPKMLEFYETCGPQIADRIMFLKQDNDTWLCKRIAA